MRLRGVWRLRRLADKIANRFAHRAVILLYHRVAEAATDPWQLSVTPPHFAEHLEALRKHGPVIPLQRLAASIKNGRLPRRAFVITFDDGYADNLLNAKPILEKYDAPATVFVASGYIGHGREFWWDELDKLFLQPGTLPETLRLDVNGAAHEWQLGNAARYTDDAFHEHRRWKAWESSDSNPRHFIYRSLWELMQPLPDGERQRVRDELIYWSGRDPAPRSTHRSLSRDEVSLLARGGLVEVGCHTVTHPALSSLAPASQEEEIRQSKACLEEILGRGVVSFAYPYGRPCDYTHQTVSLVREAGFSSACSTSASAVSRDADCFQLPRIQVTDCSGEEFNNQLKAWLGD